MIWVHGKVVSDDALSVSVLDRTFEHGLGLFETLRTWNGRAPLLGRHLARMGNASVALGIPLEGAKPPDDLAVAALLEAERPEGDVVLRITLSGGRSELTGSTLWMRSMPMPPPIRRAGAVVDLGSWRVSRSDALARFKTLNYWSRRQAYQSARALGFDEVLGTTGDGGIWEGSRSNLFIVDSDSLITPDLEGPIVPGVTRALVRELAGGLPIASTTTKLLTRDDLERADEVFLTNSVRGIIPVSRIANLSWTTPGPWTQRLSMLMSDVLSFVEEKGTDQ